jgi:hypothetical protein
MLQIHINAGRHEKHIGRWRWLQSGAEWPFCAGRAIWGRLNGFDMRQCGGSCLEDTLEKQHVVCFVVEVEIGGQMWQIICHSWMRFMAAGSEYFWGSTACVVGGLLGAAYGVEGIPATWKHRTFSQHFQYKLPAFHQTQIADSNEITEDAEYVWIRQLGTMSSMSNMLHFVLHFVLHFGLFWSNLSALSSSIDLGALAPCSTVLRSESWASAPFGAVAKGTSCSKTGQMHWIALICDQAKQNNLINHNHTYHIHIYHYISMIKTETWWKEATDITRPSVFLDVLARPRSIIQRCCQSFVPSWCDDKTFVDPWTPWTPWTGKVRVAVGAASVSAFFVRKSLNISEHIVRYTGRLVGVPRYTREPQKNRDTGPCGSTIKGHRIGFGKLVCVILCPHSSCVREHGHEGFLWSCPANLIK